MTQNTSKHLRKLTRRQTLEKNLTTGAITNLSSYTPTPNEHKLLTKGLSYIPTYNTDTSTYKTYTKEHINKLHIDYHFRNKPPYKPSLYHTKSDWTPPTPNNEQITNYTHELHKLNMVHTRPNNSRNKPDTTQDTDNDESLAIKSLTQNKNITIKRADKGGSIVIMDTHKYIDQANKHLSQTNIYKTQDKDHTKEVMDKVTSQILQFKHTSHITHQQAKYIEPKQPPRTPLFYFLPKIHKKGNPERPIISGCDSPTDKISKFLTTILNPIAQAQPSYITGTKHFLQTLNSHKTIPNNAYLVTADVTSLYTNIPHEEGISTVMEALNTHRELLPPNTPNNRIIKQFLNLILKHNYFDFMDKHYLQIQGTAMGTKMAPPYANIFMAKIEQQITKNHTEHIDIWKRFIDDIFFIWTGSFTQLTEFMHMANTIHPTIKFTFEYSKNRIHFLDTTIYINKQRQLHTTLYRKPTDKNLILHYTSHHPYHLKRNIAYTQALRYKRIISNNHQLRTELKTLTSILLTRGYPPRMIKQQISKATRIPRTELLRNRTKTHHPTLRILKTPYNTNNPTHHHKIYKLWHNTITEPTLKNLWPHSPKNICIPDKKLMDLLVHTKQHKPQTQHGDTL